MSISQAQPIMQSGTQAASISPIFPYCADAPTMRPALSIRIVGCLRRVRRSLAHPDACDMTPEHALAQQEAFARVMQRFDAQQPEQQAQALQACIPLLYNLRVPSMRVQYLRRLAPLAPGYAEQPEQFMQQLLPHIDAYGRGFSPRQVLEFAGI